MSSRNTIPIYSLDRFKTTNGTNNDYKVEVFDHNRHYNVEYPHRHDYFYEVLYIKKGSGTYVIDFQSFNIGPETIFFVSPGQVHEIIYSEDIFGYIFLFTEDFFSTTSNDYHAILFDGLLNKTEALHLKTSELQEKFTQIFKDAIQNYEVSDKFSDLICGNLLSTILLLSVRELEDSHVLYQKGKGASLVKKFKKLVDEKYAEYLSVKDYAELLSITPSHLNETVKQITGLNANRLIDNKLLIEIKRQLAYTENDITEIAFQFNFKDQSYFSRFFKAKTNLSPKEFRALNIK